MTQLKPAADDAEFGRQFMAVKRANKARLAEHIARTTGIAVDPASLFDVQVKRIHEYKRQLLNLLHLVARYQAILAHPNAGWVPRTAIFAGKAASSYAAAKSIIRLIHDVGSVINRDARVSGLLKVVFVPNYGVSVAEVIMPGADLSEQISTAGTEASGTGNMKLMMNGALTIGTLDGANVEIREAVGEENFFLFGLTADQVMEHRSRGYSPRAIYEENTRVREVLDLISSGFFSAEDPGLFKPLTDHLLNDDTYMLLADFEDYLNGFSPNVLDILENFKFRNQLPTLAKADSLGTLIEKFLDPDIDLTDRKSTRLNSSH